MRKSVHKLAEDLDLMLDTIVNPDRLMTCEKAAYQHIKERTLRNIAYNKIKGAFLHESCHENGVTAFLVQEIGISKNEARGCLIRLYGLVWSSRVLRAGIKSIPV